MFRLNIYKSLGHRFKKRHYLRNGLLPFLLMIVIRIRPPRRKHHDKTLILIRLDTIGDYVLFRVVLPHIRQSRNFRDFHITFCGNAVCKDLAEHYDKDYIDRFIWVDRTRFCKSKWYHYKVMLGLYEQGFETAIQPTYSRDIYGDILIYATQSQRRLGVRGDTSNQANVHKKVTNTFYTHLFETDPMPKFELLRNQEIATKIIDRNAEIKTTQFPTTSPTHWDGLHSPYAVIAPGASAERKQWNKFHVIADSLVSSYAFHIVITGFGKKEQRIVNRLKKQIKAPVTDVCNKTTLVEFVNVICRSALVVTNDSAALHIGALNGIPTVCISTGTALFRFNEYPESYSHVRCVYPDALEQLKGSEAFIHHSTNYSDAPDLDTVQPHRVTEAIIDVLKRN